MNQIINSRADLEAMRGAPDFAAALRHLLGATSTWVNHGTAEAPDWEQISVFSHIEALGFSQQEFMDECAAAGVVAQQSEPPATVAYVPTVMDVVRERTRRLELGFDYDFGDGRGIHRIGTTEADMNGWDEVTKASAALVALGQPNETFDIVTDTGPATVTAAEFQSILVAAAAVRQPLWAASFALQAMDPIPNDYADDSYWA